MAGTNYAVLCYMHDDYASENQKDQIQVITIYEDLSGASSVLSIVPLDPSDFVNKNNIIKHDENITGAFETNADEVETQNDDTFTTVSSLIQKNTAKYQPAVLWNGLSHNTKEYAVLCMDTADECWTIATMNNAKVLSSYAIDPGDYVKYGEDQ